MDTFQFPPCLAQLTPSSILEPSLSLASVTSQPGLLPSGHSFFKGWPPSTSLVNVSVLLNSILKLLVDCRPGYPYNLTHSHWFSYSIHTNHSLYWRCLYEVQIHITNCLRYILFFEVPHGPHTQLTYDLLPNLLLEVLLTNVSGIRGHILDTPNLTKSTITQFH